MSHIIKDLRKQKGFSQKSISQKLNISRQTLINYENKTAKFSTEIAKKFADMYDVPIESIVNDIMPIEEKHYYILPKQDKNKLVCEERVNIPQENIDKFKEVLIYILNKVGAKSNVGQTVLYKILYFIDFNYYELYEEQLMGAKYIKNTYGPTPVDFAKIIKQMQKNGDCEEIITEYFSHEQTKYLPKRQANLSGLSAQEIKHIDDTLKQYSDKSAKELSGLSHKDIPWISTNNREVIDYESVFYRTSDTSVRKYEGD